MGRLRHPVEKHGEVGGERAVNEAKPTEDYMRADPEGYEKVSKRPSFHNIRAVPRP